jgi:cleavage and polyadenylation specificity factor subunit 1
MHRILKTALKARGKYWLDQLPIVLFGIRIASDEDNNSPYSLVTGEQPLIPPICIDDSNQKELSEKLHHIIYPYRPPRQQKRKSFLPDSLKTCDFVWLRLDRIRSPLEAPYQGPYKVLHRTEDTFIIEIKSRSEVVSIDRVKPANLTPSSTQEEQITPTEGPFISSSPTRSRRKVTFNPDPFFYYY